MTTSSRSRTLAMSPQQAKHYAIFGYVVLREWFTDVIDEITTEFETVMGDFDQRADCSGTRRLRWQLLDRSPRLAALLDDQRLDSAFSAAVGPNWQYFGSVGNLYSGDTGWHVDNFSPHPRAKLALYLDPTGPGDGGLSVVPLSQHITRTNNELHLCAGTSEQSLGLTGRELPSVTLSTYPGDAILFSHNLMHSAWGGSHRRRMMSINAHGYYGPGDHEVLLTDVDHLSRYMTDGPYGHHVLDPAKHNRLRHLEQFSEQAPRFRDQVARRRALGGVPAADPLPDLSANDDVTSLIKELLRDNDYVLCEGEPTGGDSA